MPEVCSNYSEREQRRRTVSAHLAGLRAVSAGCNLTALRERRRRVRRYGCHASFTRRALMACRLALGSLLRWRKALQPRKCRKARDGCTSLRPFGLPSRSSTRIWSSMMSGAARNTCVARWHPLSLLLCDETLLKT